MTTRRKVVTSNFASAGLTCGTIYVAAMLTASNAHAAVRSTALTDALYPPDWVVKDTPERILGLYAYVALVNSASEDLERGKDICMKNGKSLRVEGSPSDFEAGDQYWLYRSKSMTVVFNQKYVAKTDFENCTAKILLQRTVKREATTSKWPFPFNPRSTAGLKGSKVERKTISGLSARCNWNGDLVGQSECVSTERDLSRGMLLSNQVWSDDFSMNASLTVNVVDPYAAIDPAIFEANEGWETAP